MKKRKRTSLTPVIFGALPVEAINNALGLELEPGEVIMTARAQQHVMNKRPSDYARCFPHVAAVVVSPLYVRDDFKNDGKIEMVARPLGLPEWLLVAIEIIIDANGRYNVASFYPISEEKVENRKHSGHYRRVLLIS